MMIKEMVYMKKIIILAILTTMIMSCSELARMEEEYQQDLRERGRRCRYNYKGEVQHCGYIN